MAKKPLSGVRLFEAMGRRAASQGRSISWNRLERQPWPMWARSAWARGWLYQPSHRQQTENIVRSFEDQARREGKTLRQTVTNFLNVEPTP